MAKHITEKQEELLMEKLIKRADDANTAFLINIGKRIKKIRNLNQNQASQLVQMLKYGGDYEKIVAEIAKNADKNVNDIDEVFSEYAKKDQEFYEQFYNYRDKPFIPYEQNITLQRQTQALANVVKNQMYDITRANVLGYTLRDDEGNPQFLGLRDTYNRVLDEAFLNVGMGKESFDTAMSRILKDLGGSGLKTIEYESGRSMRLDSAIRMHLSTRLKELHNENEQVFGEEFEADGVEISVHSNPADDHAEAQGRQFTNEQFELLQTTGTAEDVTGKIIDMHRVTKKGVSYSFRPISEMNCRHYIFSIVVGVSEPEYSDEQLEQIEYNNNVGFMYEGEHYTNYEGTQLQRKLETEIRRQKDIQILAKASNNNILMGEAQKQITMLTNKYKELSRVSGLRTKMDRLSVSGYKRTAVKVAHTSYKEQQLEIIKKTNPMLDDYHTGIRSIKDIKSPIEAFRTKIDEDEDYVYPDFTKEQAEKALKSGKITVYSSHDIKDGNFVSTSKLMAEDYAGGGKVYSKVMNIKDIAWINSGEGQVAIVNKPNNYKENNKIMNEKIKNYRKEIVDEKVEHAIVIDKKGSVYRFEGGEAVVNIPDWVNQKDSIIMHNHPENKTYYSFSKEDIKWFLSKEIKELYGDDTEYQYVIKKRDDTIKNIDNITKDWEHFYNKSLEEAMKNNIDIDEDGYDFIVKELAKKYKFDYKRIKQDLKKK